MVGKYWHVRQPAHYQESIVYVGLVKVTNYGPNEFLFNLDDTIYIILLSLVSCIFILLFIDCFNIKFIRKKDFDIKCYSDDIEALNDSTSVIVIVFLPLRTQYLRIKTAKE